MSGSTAPASTLPHSLILAGAGKMGGAMLDGWLDVGLDGHRIAVIDPQPSNELTSRLAARAVSLNPSPADLTMPAVFVLAIKPQSLDKAAPMLSPFLGPETLLVSVVAGKTIADLARAFPTVRSIARAMPNTPAAIRRGITGVAINDQVTLAQQAVIQGLLEAVGQVEWLSDESLIDAVTAVSGSGPAYVFYLAECLAKAGEAAGLDSDAAMRFARATVEGAGALMEQSPAVSPETLRRNVTSPGGTTAAALDVLSGHAGLAPLMVEAVAAAKARAVALAG